MLLNWPKSAKNTTKTPTAIAAGLFFFSVYCGNYVASKAQKGDVSIYARILLSAPSARSFPISKHIKPLLALLVIS